MLEELDASLEAQGVELVFAEMKDAVRRKIEDYGLEWMRDGTRSTRPSTAPSRSIARTTGQPKPDD